MAGNLWLVARWLLRRKQASLIPLLGGLSGAAGLALSQSTPTGLWLLPLAIDPGCLPLAISSGVAWVRR